MYDLRTTVQKSNLGALKIEHLRGGTDLVDSC